MSKQPNQSSLARFAFNIYGTLAPSVDPSPPGASAASNKSRLFQRHTDKLVYSFDKEVSCITDLDLSESQDVSNYHAVIAGKNQLRLLTLNSDQTSILNETSILEAPSVLNRGPGSQKVHNVNTLKSHNNTLACGYINGAISMYTVQNNGQAKLVRKFVDHKRCINSLDFATTSNFDAANLLISGSQDGTIKLWDLRAGSTKAAVTILPKSHFDPVRSCQFSSHSLSKNKMVVLSVHDSGTLNKYDLRAVSAGSSAPEKKWNAHTGPALSLNVHPEKEAVLTCGRDQRVCVWNYESSGSALPEHVINTYGPVMKVRWCPYSNNTERDHNYEFDEDFDATSLYNYDFACSYLNDDPTITVYNLKRKYVPKEIITSWTRKAFANFIWAKNSAKKRSIWALTKGNQFMAQVLDDALEDGSVSRPDEMLNSVAVAWGNNDDLAIVNQDRLEFEQYDRSSETGPESTLESEEDYFDDKHNKVIIGSLPMAHNSSMVSSPNEQLRPQLHRASTGVIKKSPSPSPQIKNALGFYSSESPELRRPQLNRNSSQNTVESSVARPETFGERRTVAVHHSSQYIIPVELPLALNNEAVFETLANNYLVEVPDGFNLVDVCLMNASVAASVNRFRDCQIWRLLSVGLDQHMNQVPNPVVDVVDHDDDRDDNNSISSEYGNFVGSFNSNSTATTNYGSSKAEKPNLKSAATNNLIDMIHQSRTGSFANAMSISPAHSRLNLAAAGKTADNEHAIEDDEKDLKHHTAMPLMNEEEEPAVKKEVVPTKPRRRRQLKNSFVADLDNENLTIVNPAASSLASGQENSNRNSFASSFSNQPHLARRASSLVPSLGFLNSRPIEDRKRESELTKAIIGKEPMDFFDEVPWSFNNLLRQELQYASLQGDVIICASLCLLFYAYVESLKLRFLRKEFCLEWVSLYVDVLHRKRLFVNAVSIINAAHKDIQEPLLAHYSSDALKFYCDSCGQLVTNEDQKAEKKDVGYWYCEKCKKMQSNCIYCNEPCVGLNVVVSIKCGHRGHFGCLREWFIDDENVECPGGCNISVDEL